MEFTEEHYKKLLGLPDPWEVEGVKISIEEVRVDIEVGYGGEEAPCPICQRKCGFYDHQGKRTWRHLDTMQFVTQIHCATPRVNCPEHGIKNIQVPWAGKHSRFTLLFETFVVAVLKACQSTDEVSRLLRLNWHQIDAIKKRAVQRGLARRGKEEIAWIGIDEKSFLKGQRYVSVLTDIDGARVLDVVENRDEEACARLVKQGLSAYQRKMVCGVAMDMSDAYIRSAKRWLPHADIVHDHFHISMHLNEAVDHIRRQEHRALQKNNDKRLAGTRFLWLRGFEHMSEADKASFAYLRRSSLKVAKAWSFKEMFNHFWTLSGADSAARFFGRWFDEVTQSGLGPMRKVAHTIRRHLANVLTYFSCYITNAVSEGFNSKIQLLKAKARGFRSFENYRITILFHCGKLDLVP